MLLKFGKNHAKKYKMLLTIVIFMPIIEIATVEISTFRW